MFYFLSELRTEEERDRVLRYYLRFGQAMKHEAFRCMQNEYDAEDMVQQVFAKISTCPLRYFEKEVPGKSFVYYLTTSVRNLCRDELRRRSSHPMVHYDDPELTPQEELRLENFDVKSINSLILRQCLDRIPGHYKTLLMDHYGYGFSLKELAHMYGKTLECLKSRLKRAKLALIDAAQEVVNDV